VHDVAVGEDQTVGREDEAGAVPPGLPLAIARALDGDDRRPDELDGPDDRLGVSVQKGAVVNVQCLHDGRTLVRATGVRSAAKAL
jgi:hypothetical protein